MRFMRFAHFFLCTFLTSVSLLVKSYLCFVSNPGHLCPRYSPKHLYSNGNYFLYLFYPKILIISSNNNWVLEPSVLGFLYYKAFYSYIFLHRFRFLESKDVYSFKFSYLQCIYMEEIPKCAPLFGLIYKHHPSLPYHHEWLRNMWSLNEILKCD